MILLAAFAGGMVFGWQRAGRRGGDRADKVQYGIAHGIAFALAAFLGLIVAGQLGLY